MFPIINGMKAIILAAGDGKRMQPITFEKPKALVEVAGKTLLQHTISVLPKYVDEVVLVVGYLEKQIKDFCGDVFMGKKITYVTQEKKEGTFLAVKLCKQCLTPHESFFVLYADDLIEAEAVNNAGIHEFSVVVKKVERPERFGVITLNQDGSIEEITEKPEHPKSNLAVTNVLVLTPEIFNYTPTPHKNGEYYLTSALNELAKHKKIMPVYADFWFPIGTPEDVTKAEEILKTK